MKKNKMFWKILGFMFLIEIILGTIFIWSPISDPNKVVWVFWGLVATVIVGFIIGLITLLKSFWNRKWLKELKEKREKKMKKEIDKNLIAVTIFTLISVVVSVYFYFSAINFLVYPFEIEKLLFLMLNIWLIFNPIFTIFLFLINYNCRDLKVSYATFGVTTYIIFSNVIYLGIILQKWIGQVEWLNPSGDNFFLIWPILLIIILIIAKASWNKTKNLFFVHLPDKPPTYGYKKIWEEPVKEIINPGFRFILDLWPFRVGVTKIVCEVKEHPLEPHNVWSEIKIKEEAKPRVRMKFIISYNIIPDYININPNTGLSRLFDLLLYSGIEYVIKAIDNMVEAVVRKIVAQIGDGEKLLSMNEDITKKILMELIGKDEISQEGEPDILGFGVLFKRFQTEDIDFQDDEVRKKIEAQYKEQKETDSQTTQMELEMKLVEIIMGGDYKNADLLERLKVWEEISERLQTQQKETEKKIQVIKIPGLEKIGDLGNLIKGLGGKK